MNPSLAVLRCVAWSLLTVAPRLPAQEPVAEFDAAWTRAGREQDSAAVARHAAVALSAFLRIADADARSGRIDRAVAAGFLAGQLDEAARLAAEARAGGRRGALLSRYELRTLIHRERLADFARLARADLVAGDGEGVLAAVRDDEGRLLALADRALRAGDSGDAVFAFELMVQAWPGDAIRLANLALTWRHVGDLAAARAAYEQAVRQAPADVQILSDQGLFLRATGDWPGAIAALQRSMASEAVPGEGPAVTNLVQMAVLRPGSVPADPLPAASAALGIRPDAVFLRRLTLDLILERTRNAAQQGFGKAASSR